MAPLFETFSEDEIGEINEGGVQTNTKKATNFGLSVSLVGRKLFLCLRNLQQNHEMHLTKSPKCS